MTTVMEEEPYVAAVDSEKLSIVCSYCFSDKNQTLPRCQKCKVVHYCSADCQKNDWPIHKTECGFLSHIHPIVPSSMERLITRLCIRKDNRVVAENGRRFADLIHRADEILAFPANLAAYQSLCLKLVDYFDPDPIFLPEIKQFQQYFGKALFNSFAITDREGGKLGDGLYLGLSIHDHSCAPDAILTFNGRRAILKAHAAYSPDLTIAYVDVANASVSERRAALEKRYFFTCNCPKCSEESSASPSLVETRGDPMNAKGKQPMKATWFNWAGLNGLIKMSNGEIISGQNARLLMLELSSMAELKAELRRLFLRIYTKEYMHCEFCSFMYIGHKQHIMHFCSGLHKAEQQQLSGLKTYVSEGIRDFISFNERNSGEPQTKWIKEEDLIKSGNQRKRVEADFVSICENIFGEIEAKWREEEEEQVAIGHAKLNALSSEEVVTIRPDKETLESTRQTLLRAINRIASKAKYDHSTKNAQSVYDELMAYYASPEVTELLENLDQHLREGIPGCHVCEVCFESADDFYRHVCSYGHAYKLFVDDADMSFSIDLSQIITHRRRDDFPVDA